MHAGASRGAASDLHGMRDLRTQKVQQEAVLPQDRENIAVKPDAKLYAPEEIKRGVVKGDWAIETVYGKDAVGEKAPS